MRKTLISYRNVSITSDVSEGLRQLELRLSKVGDVQLCMNPSGVTPLGKAGREISLWLSSEVYTEEQCNLILWGNAIPCGFIPFDRYPNLGLEHSSVFHFFGEWGVLFDSLCSQGKGEYAWDSLCCAALCDIGAWEGSRKAERTIQSQLHRLGYPCGIVDGVIREPVQVALKALGLQDSQNSMILSKLLNMETPQKSSSNRKHGYIVLPDIPHKVYSYGSVNTTQKVQGVAVAAEGTGRIVIDIL